MRRLSEELRFLVCGVAAALLPAPENQKAATSWGVDAAPYSMAIGLVEAVGGGLGFFFGAIASMSGSVPWLSYLLLENWFPGLSTAHMQGAGLLGLLLWCTNPLAWILILEGATGIVRIVAFVTSREAVGEPIVWLLMRVSGHTARWLAAGKRSRDLGPLRRDRLTWGRGCDLEIRTCREREQWSDGVILEVEGRFLRLVGSENVVEGAYHVMMYRFEELGEHEVVRRPFVYVDTAVVFESEKE